MDLIDASVTLMSEKQIVQSGLYGRLFYYPAYLNFETYFLCPV